MKRSAKEQAGYIEGTLSLILNSVLFVMKIWIGIVTGSIALKADAWHTASDAISSVVVIVASKISAKKPTEKHPYGYGRWDQIAALFIAFFLGAIGFNSIISAVGSLSSRTSVTYGFWAIAITAFSVLAKLLMALYAFRLGKSSGNSSVRADGWHNFSDGISSVIVLVGIIVAGHFWWMDGVLGIIVALMLFQAALEISKETIKVLLGDEPDPKLVEDIIEESTKLVGFDPQPHHFHFHDYSVEKELVFHIRLDPEIKLGEAHQIASKIETMVEKEFGIYATVHMDVTHPLR